MTNAILHTDKQILEKIQALIDGAIKVHQLSLTMSLETVRFQLESLVAPTKEVERCIENYDTECED